MLKKLILLLTLSVIFSALTVFGQEKERTVEEPASAKETRAERPPETPKAEPKQVDPPRNEPKQAETPRAESRRSDNSSNNNESRQRPNRKEQDTDSDEPSQTRRPKDDEDKTRTSKRPVNSPTENSVEKPRNSRGKPRNPDEEPENPVGNPNNGVPTNNSNPQNNNRDRDKDKKDKDEEDKRRRNRNRNGGWGNYPYPTTYPSTTTTPSTFSLRDYFDKDDVFFDTYDTYIENIAANYLPFFEDSPSLAFQPLYYSYGRKFFRNEFPFVADDWTIYYEPDLDDIFVDFSKFGQVKYERMVLYPIGETIKKVAKKFDYKGNDLRPVLVEKVPDIEQDKIYSFNVHDLPKGDYELRFIARNGAIVKHSIRLK